MSVRKTLLCLLFVSLVSADDKPARPRIDPAGSKGELLLSATNVPDLALTFPQYLGIGLDEGVGCEGVRKKWDTDRTEETDQYGSYERE